MGTKGKGQLLENSSLLEDGELDEWYRSTMEDCKDFGMPPLTDFLPLTADQKVTNTIIENNFGSLSRKKARKENAVEIESLKKERDRREKMADMYFHLQSLVPSLKGIEKPTREMIVTDATEYINFLKEEKERLEELKKTRTISQSAAGPVLSQCINKVSSVNVTASSSDVAFLGIQLPHRRTLITKIFWVLEKNQAKVLSASINMNEQRFLTLSVTVLLTNSNGSGTIEKIRGEILIL